MTAALAVYAMAGMMAAAAPLTTVSRGSISDQETARQVTARTAAEWQAVWKAHSSTDPLPAVDFSTQMVVGVFLGSKPSAGYDVEIVGTRSEGDALVVEYVVRQPGRGTMAAQIITAPYHLVAVPKHAGPVRFAEVKGSTASGR